MSLTIQHCTPPCNGPMATTQLYTASYNIVGAASIYTPGLHMSGNDYGIEIPAGYSVCKNGPVLPIDFWLS